MNVLLQIIWFLMPAALANMAPVLVKKHFKSLKYPLDFNTKFFDKERILGDHKTFRGLIFGIIFAVIGVFIQFVFYHFSFFRNLSVINYTAVNPIGLGCLIGFSVLFGDAFGSFIKRRVKIKPGAIFFPIDQIDSAVFLMIFVAPIYGLSFWFSLLVVFIWLVGHLLVNYLGWFLRIKRNKF